MDSLKRHELEDLDDLLESERIALITGDIDLLSSIMNRKNDLMTRLSQAKHADFAVLHAIDCKVRRNQLLLEGALKGIRSVARRMTALQRMRNTLVTYDTSQSR